MLRRDVLKQSLLLWLGGAALRTHAQGKAARIVLPFAAGANSDVLIRQIAHEVSQATGRVLLVDNKPGGGGILAAQEVLRAKPDGLTLLAVNTGSHAILPALQKLPYQPLHDFTMVCELFSFPNYLIVPKRLGVASVEQLLTYARQQSQPLSVGTQGMGSPGHLLATMFAEATQLPLVHVPYAAGGGPMNVDLLAGRLDMVFSTYASLKSGMQDGRVKFLAIASSQRSPSLPDIPTTQQVGLQGVDLDAWFGLAVPQTVPEAVIAHWAQDFGRIGHLQKLQGQFADQGVTLKVSSSAAFKALVQADAVRLQRIAQRAI